MAERERVRITWRSVLSGAVRGAIAYGVAIALGLLLRATAAPVLRDFNWLDRVPGYGTIGLLGAPVALVVWFLSMRAGRSVVPTGPAASLPRGSRALAIYRANRDSGADRGSAGPSVVAAVQRWDVGLTRGDAGFQSAEDVTAS